MSSSSKGNGIATLIVPLQFAPQYLTLEIGSTVIGSLQVNNEVEIKISINNSVYPVYAYDRALRGTAKVLPAKGPWQEGTVIDLMRNGSYYYIIGNPIVYTSGTDEPVSNGVPNYVWRLYADGWKEYFGRSYNSTQCTFSFPLGFDEVRKMFITATLCGGTTPKAANVTNIQTDQIRVDFAYEQASNSKSGSVYVCGY